nr:hypothetical protein [Tanacetum cinerariifolium]
EHVDGVECVDDILVDFGEAERDVGGAM